MRLSAPSPGPTRRAGCFERADRGTLFLDEIGEVSPPFQAKLLRVLQEGEVLRVGGDAPKRIDVRLVAATNRRLDEEVRAGRFREDLFFRLNVIPIALAPLRERRDRLKPIFRALPATIRARVATAFALAPPKKDDPPLVLRCLLENAGFVAIKVAQQICEDLTYPSASARCTLPSSAIKRGLPMYCFATNRIDG